MRLEPDDGADVWSPMSNTPRTSIFPTWPVYVALGIVALLIAGIIALDARTEQRVSTDTTEIIDSTRRAIVWLDRIRSRGEDLHREAATEADRARLYGDVIDLVRKIDSLGTYSDRAEWPQIQELLKQLAEAPLEDHEKRRALAKELNAAIDQLMAIGIASGKTGAENIRDAHRDAIRDHLAAGAIVLAIVTGISLILIRVLRRQRRLIESHLEALADKNQELEAFAERAAHNLRSPMSPIRGYADLIVESKDSPDEVEMMARRIRTAVDRMGRVVDDMLALSVAGRPTPGVSASAQVTTEVLEELGPDLVGVTVTTKLAGGSVACSAGVLGQILRSLVHNAVKYRDRKRPLELAIETRDVNSIVEIAVQDNGVGMDSETAAHAFEPHFRGRIDREVPGHGLGLAIVERATRALGGTCELSSVLDEGTRIAVRLPRA
jgi:signal transduction histidine kinase